MLRYETAELLEMLKRALASDMVLVSIDRRPWAYHSSYAMEEVDLHLADGPVLRAVLKDTGEMLPQARAIKPSFLMNPIREITVYREVLEPLRMDVPRRFASVSDVASNLFLLVLERLDDVPLWQVGDFSAWEEAARWVARLHERARGELPRILDSVPVLVYDKSYYRNWHSRAIALMDSHASRKSSCNDSVMNMPRQYERAIAELTQLPATFVHGEFAASNILVRTAPTHPPRIRPVDWEMAAAAPGVMDLADLCSGRWTQHQRVQLVAAYAGASDQSENDVKRSMKLCQFHRSVQWACWTEDWSPPPEHAHDWIGEAARLAASLSF